MKSEVDQLNGKIFQNAREAADEIAKVLKENGHTTVDKTGIEATLTEFSMKLFDRLEYMNLVKTTLRGITDETGKAADALLLACDGNCTQEDFLKAVKIFAHNVEEMLKKLDEPLTE